MTSGAIVDIAPLILFYAVFTIAGHSKKCVQNSNIFITDTITSINASIL